MKTDALFGVLIRALGIWEIATGLKYLPNLVGAIHQWKDDSEFFYTMLGAAVSTSGATLIVGCFLFFGANWLTRLAYPGDSAPSP